jgi:hypothetical protein
MPLKTKIHPIPSSWEDGSYGNLEIFLPIGYSALYWMKKYTVPSQAVLKTLLEDPKASSKTLLETVLPKEEQGD